MSKKKKVIVILGSTASGKTGLAVKIAYKYRGEIISADSRQVYRGMDIGTGKDLAEYDFLDEDTKQVTKIPYHLIDVASPSEQFSLADFQKQSFLALDDILQRNKLPIIAGGTGMYTQAIVDGFDLSKVSSDREYRNRLEEKSAEELLEMLSEFDFKFFKLLNNSDRNNKRRLARYIELAEQEDLLKNKKNKEIVEKYDFLLIGLKWPREVLRDRIYKRLVVRLEKEKMIEEVEALHKQGVSWERLYAFGLEYRYISLYLQKILNYEQMLEQLNIAIRQFAKRQDTWYRKWERQGAFIYWYEGINENIFKLVEDFLKI